MPTGYNLLTLPVGVTLSLVCFDTFSLVAAEYATTSLLHILWTYILPDPWGGPFGNASTRYSDLNFVLGFGVMVFVWSCGLYTKRMPWWSQVCLLTKLFAFAFVLHSLWGWTIGLHAPYIILYWVMSYGLFLLARVLVFKIAGSFPAWKIPAVVVSDSMTAEDLLFAFASDISTGYDVRDIFIRHSVSDHEMDVSGILSSTEGINIIRGSDSLQDFIRTYPEKFYIISLDAFRDRARDDILGTLDDVRASYSIVPSLSRTNLYQMEPRYFFGHDVVLLDIRSSAASMNRMSVSIIIKRLIDMIVSGTALVFAGPIILIAGAMLKIEGQGGSIFYGGERIGKDGRHFNCWKLRSMEPNSDHLFLAYLETHPECKRYWEKYRKLPKDPRVTTKTARFIRKLSLDELPQLWNIFIGDMSLVGPRPILEDETHYFGRSALHDYLSVRPGLTGLWQVSGRNKTSFKRRVYWDSWYVRNWSLWSDIIILIKTPLVLLSRKGVS